MQNKKMTILKMVIGIVLSIGILIVSQTVVLWLGELLAGFDVYEPFCNIIVGFLYVGFSLAGVKILCGKFLKVSMAEMRIPSIRLKPIWIIAAVLMPILVIIGAVLAGGYWKIHTFAIKETLEILTSAIFYYGFAAGLVEEIIFRGIIMGCLEKKFNIKIAVVIPSVLFGVLHMVGNHLDVTSMIQVLVAGSIVGILFSLIAYESGSIWNSAFVHCVWNMTLISGIVFIGKDADDGSIFNFVLGNKSFVLTGGDFGIEASVIAIFAYLIFIVVAADLLRHGENR